MENIPVNDHVLDIGILDIGIPGQTNIISVACFVYTSKAVKLQGI